MGGNMPYENEHSCRILDPGKFQKDSFRRIKQGKLSIIIGKLIGKTKTTAQAYRYPIDQWSAEEARRHCKDAGGRFEAARKEVSGVERVRFVDLLLAELGEGNTTEVEVARVGHWFHRKHGEIDITDADLDTIVSNFSNGVRAVKDESGNNQLLVDYDHFSSDDEGDPEKNKASGWIKRLFRVGDLVKAVVEWTEKAAEYIQKKEYQYISPEISFAYQDKQSGQNVGATLIAAALTNRPFFEEQMPVLFSEALDSRSYLFVTKTDDGVEYGPDAWLYVPDPNKPSTWKLRIKEVVKGRKQITRAQLGRAAAAFSPGGFRGRKVQLPPGEKEKVKNALVALYRKLGVEDEDIPKYLLGKEAKDMDEAKLREALGIAEDADIDQAIKDLKTKGGEVGKLNDQIKAKDTEVGKLNDQIKAKDTEIQSLKDGKNIVTKGDYDALEKRLTDTETQLKLRDRDALVAQFRDKITPAVREQWADEMALKDPEAFKKVVASMPVIAELDDVKGGGGDGGEGDVETEYLLAVDKVKKEQKVDDIKAAEILKANEPELYQRYNEHRKKVRGREAHPS